MEKLRLEIAGREYPLSAPAHEVENLKRAAALINEQFSTFQEQFQVHDPVDLLAMTALHLSSSSASAATQTEAAWPSDTLNRMRTLQQRIRTALDI